LKNILYENKPFARKKQYKKLINNELEQINRSQFKSEEAAETRFTEGVEGIKAFNDTLPVGVNHNFAFFFRPLFSLQLVI
jgi:hypothetical protein